MALCCEEPVLEFVLNGKLPWSALRPLQSLTGGTKTDLDGIPTYNFQGGEILPVLINGAVQFRAFDLNPPQIADDVAPVDNPNARWMKVGGL